jgi:hypothetical protein
MPRTIVAPLQRTCANPGIAPGKTFKIWCFGLLLTDISPMFCASGCPISRSAEVPEAEECEIKETMP